MKKNTVFFLGMLAVVLTFGVLLTACSKKAEAQTSGGSADDGTVKTEAKSSGGGKEAPASDFDYQLTADSRGVEIIGYKGKGGNVIIPATIEGIPVLSLGKLAFMNNEKLTTVFVPASVEIIKGELTEYTAASSSPFGAFLGCRSLTKVELSEGLKEIGSFVFYQSNKLTTVNLPASLEKIDSSGFFDLPELSNLLIPDTLTSVKFGNSAFRGSNKLPLATQKRLRDLGYTGEF